jgi:hypothetical protein
MSEAVSTPAPTVLRPPGHPLRFLARLALITLAVLWLAHAGSVATVDLLLPAIRAEVTALDDNLSIDSLEQVQDGPNQVVRMRGNLRRPIFLGGRAIYPHGWLPHTAGGYQVYLNTIGVLEAPAILLILVLSWPHRTSGELLMRAALAAPLLLVLLALDSPAELVGNFQHTVLLPVDGFSALFAWDRVLEGGGNCALALAFAGLAIVWARSGQKVGYQGR